MNWRVMHATDWVETILADLPPLVTVDEAMTALRCSRRSLYRLTSGGRLLALRQEHAGSSKLLIPKTSIAAYLRSLQEAA